MDPERDPVFDFDRILFNAKFVVEIQKCPIVDLYPFIEEM